MELVTIYIYIYIYTYIYIYIYIHMYMHTYADKFRSCCLQRRLEDAPYLLEPMIDSFMEESSAIDAGKL